MQIEVDSLDEAGAPFAHSYADAELDLEDERARIAGETQISGRAARKSEQIRVHGALQTNVEVLCDRCLTPIETHVAIEFDVTYVPLAIDASKEASELQDEEMSFSVYEGEAIDVDELVREQVLLALPTRLLCREDCKGLCPTCGADLNRQTCACKQREVDPRWAALAALKNNNGATSDE